MSTSSDPGVYHSTVRFDSDPPISTAVVHCSDARFIAAVDDLLRKGLGLAHCDRLVVPGGPACLADRFDTWREEESSLRQLQFLVEAHRLEQVVLIAHDDCKFYQSQLRVSPMRLAEAQREDLAKAAKRVQELSRRLVVRCYTARIESGAVVFEEV